MQPPTPSRESLGQLVLPVSPLSSVTAPASERVEERPHSELARGSYAWPAWAVIVVAVVSAIGGFSWWLNLQRRRRRASVVEPKSPVSKSVAS